MFTARYELIPCIKQITMWSERKPNRCNNQMFIINLCHNMFRASLCPSSGELRPCYSLWCTVLVLLDPHPVEPAHIAYDTRSQEPKGDYISFLKIYSIQFSQVHSLCHVTTLHFLAIYWVTNCHTSCTTRNSWAIINTTEIVAVILTKVYALYWLQSISVVTTESDAKYVGLSGECPSILNISRKGRVSLT